MSEPLYAAFHSSPDYTAHPPSFVSVHKTLEGAKRALYPDSQTFRDSFILRVKDNVWDGPDGFGLIRLIEIKP